MKRPRCLTLPVFHLVPGASVCPAVTFTQTKHRKHCVTLPHLALIRSFSLITVRPRYLVPIHFVMFVQTRPTRLLKRLFVFDLILSLLFRRSTCRLHFSLFVQIKRQVNQKSMDFQRRQNNSRLFFRRVCRAMTTATRVGLAFESVDIKSVSQRRRRWITDTIRANQILGLRLTDARVQGDMSSSIYSSNLHFNSCRTSPCPRPRTHSYGVYHCTDRLAFLSPFSALPTLLSYPAQTHKVPFSILFAV
jgi:hypothetical protein